MDSQEIRIKECSETCREYKFLLDGKFMPGIEKLEDKQFVLYYKKFAMYFWLVGMPFRQKPPEKVGVIWGQIKPKAFILSGTLSS
mgnify:CR=1 FL=1